MLTFLCGYSEKSLSEIKEIDYDVYLAPTSSTLCQSLKKNLEEKRKNKHKLNYLHLRNINLQKQVPKRKKSIIAKLKENEIEIKIKKHKNLLRIQAIEEKVIRKGCPGLLSPGIENLKENT
jgi:hypothetical protein